MIAERPDSRATAATDRATRSASLRCPFTGRMTTMTRAPGGSDAIALVTDLRSVSDGPASSTRIGATVSVRTGVVEISGDGEVVSVADEVDDGVGDGVGDGSSADVGAGVGGVAANDTVTSR
jgi:hypothetical protein